MFFISPPSLVRLISLVLLLSCAERAHAQEPTTAPELPPQAPTPVVAEVPAQVQPQPESATPAVVTPASVSRPITTGPFPGWAVWQELQVLQAREAELWAKRESRSVAGPAVGIGMGIVATFVLLPIGSILLVDSSYEDYSGAGYGVERVDEQQQRLGRSLITMGVLAVATAVFCGWRIRQIKQARVLHDRELYSVANTRTALENVLGHLLQTPAPAAAP